MSLDLNALKAVLVKMESADLAILGSDLVPAVLQEVSGLVPDPFKPLAAAVLSAIQGPLQSALADLIAKIPKV